MSTILTLILIVTGIIFVTSVLMMSPKWWLGMGIGWAAAKSGDYGSKKSMETTLKKVAIISAILFVIAAVALPFVK